jgi:hypothetical protein
MNITRRLAMTAGFGTALSLFVPSAVRAQFEGFGAFEGLEDFWLATDAYILGTDSSPWK